MGCIISIDIRCKIIGDQNVHTQFTILDRLSLTGSNIICCVSNLIDFYDYKTCIISFFLFILEEFSLREKEQFRKVKRGVRCPTILDSTMLCGSNIESFIEIHIFHNNA